MTPNQIGVLATEGESETLEFKKTTGERREAAKTMCAMVNTRGGRIVFGITKDLAYSGQLLDNYGLFPANCVSLTSPLNLAQS